MMLLKKTQKIRKTFWNFQYPEKYCSRVQQLAHRGWHQVNRQEELLTVGGQGGGRWQGWRVLRRGNDRRPAISLMSATEGTDLDSDGFNSIHSLEKTIHWGRNLFLADPAVLPLLLYLLQDIPDLKQRNYTTGQNTGLQSKVH